MQPNQTIDLKLRISVNFISQFLELTAGGLSRRTEGLYAFYGSRRTQRIYLRGLNEPEQARHRPWRSGGAARRRLEALTR